MRIGLDFGGVIGDTISVKADIVRQRLGIVVRDERELLRDVLLPRVGDKEYADLIRELERRITDSPLFPNVQSVLSELHAEGDTFFMVSTQIENDAIVLADYVRQHDLPIDDVLVVRDDCEKLARIREGRAEAFFDDSPRVHAALTSLTIIQFWANFRRAEKKYNFDMIEVHSWLEFRDQRRQFK